MPDGVLSLLKSDIRIPVFARAATERDEAALFDLLMDLDRDNGFGHPINPDRVLDTIRRGTRHVDAFIGVVDAPDGRLAASVALMVTQYWYSDDCFLAEQWLYVRPEYRKGGEMNAELFRWADAMRGLMSREAGKEWEIISAFWTRSRLAAKLRLWRRYARQVGGVFIIGGGR